MIRGLVAEGVIVGIPACSMYSDAARDEASPALPMIAAGFISIRPWTAVLVVLTLDWVSTLFSTILYPSTLLYML